MKNRCKIILIICLIGITIGAAAAEPVFCYFTDFVKSAASFKLITDVTPPVISDNNLNKIYFISDSAGLSLADFASAYDETDGDITHKMQITSTPEFDPQKAANYTVIYNVSDESGNQALPLTVNIVIWDFVQIEAGTYHTLALTSHGKVYTWGANLYGQLADGTTNQRNLPMPITGLDNIVSIAAGTACSYAIDASGNGYAWGRGSNGRLGIGNTNTVDTPTKIAVPAGVKLIKIAAGDGTAGAVTDTGEVYAWGYGICGAVGTGRGNDELTPVKLALTDIQDISFGYFNGAAVSSDGKLYTWGDNANGQLGRGLAMAVSTNAPGLVEYFSNAEIKIKNVSLGWYHAAAVSQDGKLYTWGMGDDYRLGNNSITDRNTPQEIPLPESAASAEAGYYSTSVIAQSGNIYFFGQNGYGKLGNDSTVSVRTPAVLAGFSDISSVALGFDTTLIIVQGRNVYASGYGGSGLFGNNTILDSAVFKPWIFTPPGA